MKYIRTKGGNIYEESKVSVVKENGIEIVILGSIGNKFIERTRGITWNDGTNVIVKQADTIEELCDEYVVKHINMLTPMLIDKSTISLKEIKTQYSGNDNFEYIYCAIWVFDNNGAPALKPVAKLNNKEELELL